MANWSQLWLCQLRPPCFSLIVCNKRNLSWFDMYASHCFSIYANERFCRSLSLVDCNTAKNVVQHYKRSWLVHRHTIWTHYLSSFETSMFSKVLLLSVTMGKQITCHLPSKTLELDQHSSHVLGRTPLATPSSGWNVYRAENFCQTYEKQ